MAPAAVAAASPQARRVRGPAVLRSARLPLRTRPRPGSAGLTPPRSLRARRRPGAGGGRRVPARACARPSPSRPTARVLRPVRRLRPLRRRHDSPSPRPLARASPPRPPRAHTLPPRHRLRPPARALRRGANRRRRRRNKALLFALRVRRGPGRASPPPPRPFSCRGRRGPFLAPGAPVAPRPGPSRQTYLGPAAPPSPDGRAGHAPAPCRRGLPVLRVGRRRAHPFRCHSAPAPSPPGAPRRPTHPPGPAHLRRARRGARESGPSGLFRAGGAGRGDVSGRVNVADVVIRPQPRKDRRTIAQAGLTTQKPLRR